MKITPETALIVVDIQNDFCPGGALPVPRGDEVVPVMNRYIKKFQAAQALVIATRDWHPADHCSFKPNGGIWPVHCVQNSPGAQFHPALSLPTPLEVISKGSYPKVETYSGFHRTHLMDFLKKRGVRTVWVGGLAADYCVKSTVLDALKAGFEVMFLEDASRGVDLNLGDCQRAEEEMIKAGARKLNLTDAET